MAVTTPPIKATMTVNGYVSTAWITWFNDIKYNIAPPSIKIFTSDDGSFAATDSGASFSIEGGLGIATSISSDTLTITTDLTTLTEKSQVKYNDRFIIQDASGSGEATKNITAQSLLNYANVKHFGALGNGATDDTDAFKAALATGLSVYVPASVGKYVITSSLLMSTSGQCLFGSGTASEIQFTSVDDCIEITGENCTVSDLKFTGGYVANNRCFYVNAAKECKLINLDIRSFGTFLTWDNGGNHLYLTNWHTRNALTYGIELKDGTGAFLTNVFYDTDGTWYSGYNSEPTAFLVINNEGNVVSNCDFIHPGQGVVIEPNGRNITWNLFQNSFLSDSGQSGDAGIIIRQSSDTYFIRGQFFNHCWSATNERGVLIDGSGTADCDGIIFKDCMFHNNRKEGIRVLNGKNIRFKDCEVAGNVTDGGSISNSYFNSADGEVELDSCYFGREFTWTSTPDYHINVDSSTNFMYIINCQLDTNVTSGDMNINTSNIVMWNYDRSNNIFDTDEEIYSGKHTLKAADSNEGGQIDFLPGTGYSDTFSIDSYQNSGRIWFNTANNKTLELQNFGAGSLTVNVGGTLAVTGAMTSPTITALAAPSYVTLGTDSTLANERVLTAGEGIDLTDAGAGSTITISGEDASTSNKGIASFDGTDFSVSSGAVSLQAERIQDIVGAMTTGNTETLMSVTYQDADGTLDFVVDEANIDHDNLTNTHNLTTDIDHNTITNNHNLTTDIDHDTLTNAHNLTTDIDHDTLTNTHNLTTDIDHDQLTNYVANEHIDWTNASSNLVTTGTITCDDRVSIGPSDVNEGGQFTLEPGTGYSDNFDVDSYQDSGRLFFNTANNKTIEMNNYGAGSLTVNINGDLGVTGTVDGRDIATDGTKLDGIETGADVTDEANVTDALDGATLTAATLATNDKVLIQDTDGSDVLKTVTTQAIADIWTSHSSNINTTGTIACDNNVSVGPSSTSEGGELRLEPGTSYSDTFYVDSFNDDGRLFFNTTNNRTVYVSNYGSGSVTFDVQGTLSKSSGTFKIDHPLDPDNKYLYYGFIEGPRYDLIHRGKAKLKRGHAKINLDEEYKFIPGTFEALTKNVQVFVTNNNSFDKVIGRVKKNILYISSEHKDNIEVDWMVIAERNDKHIKESHLTDDHGSLINEVDKARNV